METKTKISKDPANKKMFIARDFDAPLAQVWNAWTDSKILDQWWAPQPYQAKTKSMDFREGGFWLYAMVGPDGDKMWARLDYHTIAIHDNYTATDSFCDENGVKAAGDFPNMHWVNSFRQTDHGTKVEIEITFKSEANMAQIIEMGFEIGFTAACGNLDALLKK